MRGYWVRIVLKALGIAAVGIAIVTMARRGAEATHRVVETADPISIPLAFIPFNLDGQRVGAVKRLRILRSAPESVTGFNIRVEVADLATYEALSRGCVLSIENPTRLSPNSSFSCQASDAVPGLEAFGSVEVLLAEGSNTRIDVPLFLPTHVIHEFRGRGADSGAVATSLMTADSVANAMRRMADSIRQQTRAYADSVRREAAARPPSP